MIHYIERKEGNIFIIPLFLPDDFETAFKSYSRNKFDPEKEYAFGRLIDDGGKGGEYLIEIFKYTGSIPESKDIIIKSGRLFKPIHAVAGFEKKRWRFVFEDLKYDKYKDSDYDKITFVLGGYECPVLWQGGKTIGNISVKESKQYYHWIIYLPTDVSTMIKKVLKGDKVSFAGES